LSKVVTISRRGRSFGQHIQSNNESSKVVVSIYFRYNILQSTLLKIKLQNEQQSILNKQVYKYCKKCTIMSINLKLLTNHPNENLLTFYRKQPGCKAKQQLVKLTAEAASSWDPQTLTH